MYSEDSIILGLLAVLGFLIFFFIIIGIIFYVLNAIGLFKIAKKMGKEDLAFMAWIPVANSFLVPILVEKDVHEEIRGKFTLIFAISFIASIILGWFFTPFSFIYLIAYLYGFYFLAKKFSKNVVAHTVIGAVTLGASTAISFFMFRNREPIQDI